MHLFDTCERSARAAASCSLRIAVAAMGLLPIPAVAAETHLSFAAFAAGLNVLNVEATLELNPADYRIQFVTRTAGAFGLVVRGEMQTTVNGVTTARGVVPSRSYSYGTFRGVTRRTQIDYPGGQPQVRALEPLVDPDRDPVPVEMTRDTMDPESAMAGLMYRVNATGRCEGSARLFDGRRLSEVRAVTAGTETLPDSSDSAFTGPALRCDFEGRQLAGFMHDASEAELKRVQRGSAWFASLAPGRPAVPVRMQFTTRFFGAATMYLTKHD